MARKKKQQPTADPKSDFLSLARKRHDLGVSAEEHNREAALSDLLFLNGEQWDVAIRTERNN